MREGGGIYIMPEQIQEICFAFLWEFSIYSELQFAFSFWIQIWDFKSIPCSVYYTTLFFFWIDSKVIQHLLPNAQFSAFYFFLRGSSLQLFSLYSNGLSLMLLSLCLTSWTSNHNFVSLYGYHILKLNMNNQHLKHINIDRRHHHTHKQQKKKKSGTIDRKLEANHTIRIQKYHQTNLSAHNSSNFQNRNTCIQII